jgi:L-2-hydroxyglutarate oxidase LhgO
VLHGPRDHGIPGVVNLYGIESPGLTAALALADEVKRLLEDGDASDGGARPKP